MATLLPLDPDELLSTTRSVRKRLDFSRPVEPELIRECIDVATQAPTGGNNQGWHFVVVTDEAKRRQLQALLRYRFSALAARNRISFYRCRKAPFDKRGAAFLPGSRL